MSQSKALYRLQKIDLDLDARYRRIEEINGVLEQDQELRQAQLAVNEVREKLRPAETQLADLTLEMKTVAGQADQLGERLYSGQVNNPKELEDIQNKIAERRRYHASLENRLLETMITVEELQAALDTASGQLDHVKSSRASDHEALEAELQRQKQEIKRLKAERKAAEQPLEPDSLTLYQTMRPRKQGHPVSVMKEDACSACGVSQTSVLAQQVRQDRALVFCEGCGRILVAL